MKKKDTHAVKPMRIEELEEFDISVSDDLKTGVVLLLIRQEESEAGILLRNVLDEMNNSGQFYIIDKFQVSKYLNYRLKNFLSPTLAIFKDGVLFNREVVSKRENDTDWSIVRNGKISGYMDPEYIKEALIKVLQSPKPKFGEVNPEPLVLE